MPEVRDGRVAAGARRAGAGGANAAMETEPGRTFIVASGKARGVDGRTREVARPGARELIHIGYESSPTGGDGRRAVTDWQLR